MARSDIDATRSNRFVAWLQVEGLCVALRQLVPRGIDPGPLARAFLRSLRDGFVQSGSGLVFEHIPEVSDTTSPAELLVMAETLRSSMVAFFTPEEIQERRRIGFGGVADIANM